MRIIALETTQRIGTLAALEDDEVLRELTLPRDQRSAQSLAPSLRDLLAEVGWRAGDLDLVAVAQGPGSFTGLRIGVTTAKTLAYAAGAAIVGVPTLEAIAIRAPEDCQPIEAIISAERQQLFAARFADREGSRFCDGGETQLIDIDTWLTGLKAGTSVTGPALAKLVDRITSDVNVLDPSLWAPTASSVGQLGVLAYREGRRDDVWQMVPNYHRQSAAEERARTTGDK